MDSTAKVAIRNLADLVRESARRHPAKAALRHGPHTLHWGDLDAGVDTTAAALRERGVGPGARVGIALGNTSDFAISYFAVLRLGAIAVPISTAFTPPEMGWLVHDAGIRLGIADEQTGARLQAAGAPAVVERAELRAAPAGGSADCRPLEATGGDDTAVLLYTSGTAGRPKGAMLSHRALLANLEQTAEITPPVMGADDVILLVLPLSHIYGLAAGLGAVAWHGATGVLVDRFDALSSLEVVRQYGVTTIVGAPPMYVAWSMLSDLAGAFAGVRLALSGAAPLPAQTLARMQELTGHPVYEGYGLTETAAVVTSTLMSETVKPGSVGRPLPGVALRLVDDQGQAVDDGDVGEICVRGANLFSGYWPDRRGGPDAAGWWATGDIAYADPDGDLFLVDRRRDLILVSGFNVYPREVEDVLTAHPDVAEAAVIGVPHPHTGESVKALVVARPGTTPSADELIEHAARSLARFKCPTAVEFVDELPHSATGKVSKGTLRGLHPSR